MATWAMHIVANNSPVIYPDWIADSGILGNRNPISTLPSSLYGAYPLARNHSMAARIAG
jgi:hypothetical protein